MDGWRSRARVSPPRLPGIADLANPTGCSQTNPGLARERVRNDATRSNRLRRPSARAEQCATHVRRSVRCEPENFNGLAIVVVSVRRSTGDCAADQDAIDHGTAAEPSKSTWKRGVMSMELRHKRVRFRQCQRNYVNG
jgi:hypothetical protein